MRAEGSPCALRLQGDFPAGPLDPLRRQGLLEEGQVVGRGRHQQSGCRRLGVVGEGGSARARELRARRFMKIVSLAEEVI